VVEKSNVTPRQIAHFMVGRELNWESPPQKADASSVPPVLTVKNLYRRWPNHPRQWKLRDVSFEARPGEIVGFAGLMGAGRTELFECLFGQSEDDFHGDVRVNGRAVRFHHPAEAIEAGVAMVTEDRKRLGLFSNLCVAANISLNSLSRDSRVSGLISGTSERQRCQSIVDQLRVKTDGLTAAIGSLSGGNQQKCVIGRSLLTEPRVLLLDDPTRGVDVGAKSEIYRLIRDLANKGLAVLMASSELPELLHLCDRIIVLSEGVMTAEFSARDATEQNIMEAATLNQKFASV
ncbi:MAG: ATP-binding cassette domain-containing protein, partial [Pirellulaceae bacterium]